MKDEMSLSEHIGVLMGGPSSERPISLKSGKAVYEALGSSGCHVSAIDIPSSDVDEIIAILKNAKIDIAFIALHGQLGEDGVIQSILEKLHIPYTGPGVKSSQLAMNKILAQNIFKQNHIPVPPFRVVNKNNKRSLQTAVITIDNYPVMVKPASQGSSIGITLVENKNDLAAAVEKALEYDGEVLIERYIRGKELTVGILDDRPLPVIEIRPHAKFFDFTAKYESGTTEYIIPAQLPDDVARRVQKMAWDAFCALRCRDLSRVDIMLDDEQNPFVIEINTIPGFTATSLLPKAAKVMGIDFPQLCLTIVQLAYRRKKVPETSGV